MQGSMRVIAIIWLCLALGALITGGSDAAVYSAVILATIWEVGHQLSRPDRDTSKT